jgi:glycosyltransferase involved in cell wall biosynthesis
MPGRILRHYECVSQQIHPYKGFEGQNHGNARMSAHLRILVLLPRIPVPARDGGAIVMLETIRSLHAAGHHVDVCAVNTPKHNADPSVMEQECSSINAVDIDTSIRPLRMLRELLSSRFPDEFRISAPSSYWLTRFASVRVLERIEQMIVAGGPYDVVLCESLFTACYGEALRRRQSIDAATPIVLHAHNVEARIQDRLAKDPSRSAIERAIRRRLAEQTRAYENHVLTWCDGVITLSPVDAGLFAVTSPSTQIYSNAPGVRENIPDEPREPMSLWFLGSLDWTPNVDGLRWFMRSVWPIVQREAPEATLHIAGRSTPAEVLAYDDGTRVLVHGEIEDPTFFRSRFEVGIVPLQSGSGVRIKIIEALMDHSAIVTTAIGCEGLPLVDGVHARIADDASAFAQACVSLMRDTAQREEMRTAGADALRGEYSWEASAQRLDQILRTFVATRR